MEQGTTPNQHCIISVIRTKNWFELSPSAPENIFMRSPIGFLQNPPDHGHDCGGSASEMNSSEANSAKIVAFRIIWIVLSGGPGQWGS